MFIGRNFWVDLGEDWLYWCHKHTLQQTSECKGEKFFVAVIPSCSIQAVTIIQCFMVFAFVVVHFLSLHAHQKQNNHG